MAATYTFDILATLDGYASYTADGDWGGYWSKHGPEFLDRRLAIYSATERMVLGANTYRQFAQMIGLRAQPEGLDPINSTMRDLPTTVVSSTLEGPFDWPDATVVSGDAIEIVGRLKEESEQPLLSHGSLTLNRALMAAGLVDFLQITIIPVISGRTGDEPVFAGAADFDLELVSSRTFDGRTQELIYRPTLHG